MTMIRSLKILVISALLPVGNYASAEMSFNTLTGTQTGAKDVLLQHRNTVTTDKGTLTGNWWPWGVRAADFDKDGDLDVYVNYHSSAGSLILKNMLKETGSLSFTRYAALPYGDMPAVFRPVMIDFNKDGYIDIGGDAGISLESFSLKNVNGSFVRLNNLQFRAFSAADDIRDFDNDGDMDIRIIDTGVGKAYLSQATSNGNDTFQFSRVEIPRPAGLPTDLLTDLAELEVDSDHDRRADIFYGGAEFWEGDLDGDNDNDVVMRYTGSYFPSDLRFGRYLIRNAQGVLEDKTAQFNIPGVPELPPIDVNKDNRRDIFTTHQPGSGLYYQQPNGSFLNASPTVITPFVQPTNFLYDLYVKFNDIDKDGDLDLFVSTRRNKTARIFEQGPNGVFSQEGNTLNHWDSDGYELIDINNDGMTDILIGGPGTGSFDSVGDVNFTILLNTAHGSTEPPTDPEDPVNPPDDPTPPIDNNPPPDDSANADDNEEPFKNVFNPKTGTLTIPAAKAESVSIYDKRGGLVVELPVTSGDVTWNGRNSKGEKVSSGVYIALIKESDKTTRKKFIVIK